MLYIRNITKGNVRIGVGVENNINLEPSVVVLEIDPKTRERKTRPGEDVAQVQEEKFNDVGVGIKRSQGILFELISQEEFEARLDELNSYHASESGEMELQGFLNRDHKMKLNTEGSVPQEALTRIPIDEKTLELQHVGAEHGTRSRPDPAEGGKTLTELRAEGVQRSQDAPAIDVDASVLNQMGQGS